VGEDSGGSGQWWQGIMEGEDRGEMGWRCEGHVAVALDIKRGVCGNTSRIVIRQGRENALVLWSM
jgi:hypothetical protein